MTDAGFDPRNPALRLASASRTGMALKDLPADERPQTLEQGYAVQAAFVDGLGDGIAGWKLAGASPRGLRGELPNPPATGLLGHSRIVQSGGTVQLPPGRSATLEVEVAFCFARAVSPAHDAFDAASMIAYATVAVEVVCSRFLDRKAVGQPSFVADNVGFHALVLGDKLEFCDSASFDEDAGLWRDGERIANGMTGDDRTKPFLSLGHLWEKLRKQGSKIAEGSLVTTGTLTVPVDVTAGGYYEGRIGGSAIAFTLR
ncbi:fumarylacetoacetate hydrolase family protein [Cupriavidus sp. AcVe19-1a]|uniref:fumarylacetoacetate hydrolase family protein n=1 Tax=Cupriavidus sp. AcVe19-1a TaxID=2821359 RepID=UPI001AEA3802|nr:fumarylacetoacetate hydrolase family protein [Cupriavidus sp. AcVe19-1a]MBP0632743.1 fumarylacetoacetate hydrolase family protein [Cupriavidus sp. AcVe19-1a]